MSDLVGGWLELPKKKDDGLVGGWLKLPEPASKLHPKQFTGHGISGTEAPAKKFKNGKARIASLSKGAAGDNDGN